MNKHYLQDIQKIVNTIAIFRIIHKNHYEIEFEDQSQCSIVLENGKYHLDLLKEYSSENLFKDFKFYLDCIIDYADLKRFVKDLFRYYSDQKIVGERS